MALKRSMKDPKRWDSQKSYDDKEFVSILLGVAFHPFSDRNKYRGRLRSVFRSESEALLHLLSRGRNGAGRWNVQLLFCEDMDGCSHRTRGIAGIASSVWS